MRIVRLVRGLRVVVALAVGSFAFVLPARPSEASTVFAGACTVNNLPFLSTVTPSTLGPVSTSLSFTAGCIYHSDLTSSMTGAGFVSGTVGACGVGVLTQQWYSVKTFNMEFEGLLVVVNDGASLTLTFNSTPPALAFAGTLVPTRTNSAGCPAGWTGALVVEDPTLDS